MRGTTLIELLIATSLSGLAIAGALTGFARIQRASRDGSAQGQLHERAQYVFASLEPELQMAGYFGPGPAPSFPIDPAPPSSATQCGVAVLARLDRPVEVHRGLWPLSCPANGRGAMPDSDVLVVRRASTAQSTGGPGPIRIRSSLALPDLRGIFWPGHSGTSSTVPLPGTELRDLLLRVYYISRSSDGDDATPALRVKSLTSIAGQPAFMDTEVMAGVDNLQVTLLPAATDTQSVRISLRVRAEAGVAGSGDPLPQLTLHRRFGLRNAR